MANATTRETRGVGSRTDGVLLRTVENCATREFGDYVGAVVSDVLHAEGVADPRAGEWYDTPQAVAVCDAVDERVGPNTIERVGRRLPVVVEWPAGVRTIGDALGALGDVYDDLHAGDVGTLTFEPTDASAGRLVSTTPYPTAFDEGLVHGVGREFGQGAGFVTVERAVETSAGETVFDCRWWEAPERR